MLSQIGEVSLAMELSREVADGHLIGSVGQNVRKHPQAEGRLNYYIVGSWISIRHYKVV